jgi:hypothetical protein
MTLLFTGLVYRKIQKLPFTVNTVRNKHQSKVTSRMHPAFKVSKCRILVER